MESSDDDSSSDSVESEAASAAKPLTLDPESVRALAASAGCQELIGESGNENINNNVSRGRGRLHYATTSTSSDYPISFDTTQTTSDSEEEEDPSINAAPSFLSRLRKTFSRDEEDDNSSQQQQIQKHSPRENEHILSFLAFDPLSVDQLVAEADGKKNSGNELDEAGVARVDVYCRSGTVIISRVVSVVPNCSEISSSKDDSSTSARSSEDDINEPPVLPGKASNTQNRRIIRQNVSREALRCIFANPPKLATIDESIFAHAQEEKVNEKVNDEAFHATRDEIARRHVANAIITRMGIGGDDLERVMKLDSFDHKPATDVDKTSKLLSLQIDIKRKIEIADVGLAILMGEREKLKKMMSVKKGDSLEQDDESESSRSASCDNEAEELARQSRIMGCEVEYSFPSDLADYLEAALMGQSTNDDNDSSDSDDSRNDVRRGRSKTKRKILPGESKPKKRQLGLSAIAAIPTNGEGCVVLRKNGAFNVVGLIPKILEELLFRDDAPAPFPEYIALGSNDRYFVKFDDGSYYFYGPTSLTRIIDEKMSKTQKGNHKNGEHLSLASIAFGKELDDFFVVFSDGSWECDGDLHKGLDKLLIDRGNRADLLWVSLGPDNEFCLKARNGRVWWGGVSDEIREALCDITERSETDVKYISFGVDGSFFLTHRG